MKTPKQFAETLYHELLLQVDLESTTLVGPKDGDEMKRIAKACAERCLELTIRQIVDWKHSPEIFYRLDKSITELKAMP